MSRALHPECVTVAYCENDDGCRRVLQCNMDQGRLDSAPIYDDVRTLTAVRLKADGITPPAVITAGFPCQDISIAGSYRGLEGERSGLFYHIPRLIRSLPSVRHVVLENSSMVKDALLTTILNELRAAGMTRIAFGYYNASDVGALHRRRRWVCLATRESIAAHLPRPLPASSFAWDWARADLRFTRFTRRNPNRYRDVVRRCSALGNSVVPQFIAYAVNTLLEALREKNSGAVANTRSGGATYMCDSKGRISVACTSFKALAHNTIQLRIKDTAGTIHLRHRWPTPIHSTSHWYKTPLTHPRQLKMFVGVALHDQNRPPPAPAKEVMINPRFVEHLMGFPVDWTAGLHRSSC